MGVGVMIKTPSRDDDFITVELKKVRVREKSQT
jgi:hypothetical protein